MSTIVKYVVFQAPGELECDDLHEAMRAAHFGMDNNDFYPKEIISDGVVYGEEEMSKYLIEHNFGE